jgi:O-antigen/teichoic acid export membrane protein
VVAVSRAAPESSTRISTIAARQAAEATGLLTLIGAVAGGSNLLFHVILARKGGTAAYGALGSILAMVTVATFLATGVNYAVARMTVAAGGPSLDLVRRALRSESPLFAIGIVILACAIPLSHYLHLSSPPAVILAALLFMVIVANAVPVGVLVGAARFRAVAAIQLGTTLARLGAALAVPGNTSVVIGALVASVVPIALFGVIATALVAREEAATRPHPASARIGIAREGMTGAALAGTLWGVWSLPSAFARHGLSAVGSGNFAAAQLMVGGVLFLTSPLIMVFYSATLRDRRRRMIAAGLGVSLCLAVGSGGVISAAGPTIMHHLYGGQFQADTGLFLCLAISAIATALTTFTFWMTRAAGRHRGAVSWGIVIGVGCELALAWPAGTSVNLLALSPAVALVTGLVTALAVGQLSALITRAPRPDLATQ